MLTRKTGPETPLVSLPQMKLHLRVDPQDEEEDALIQALIDAAISHIDGPRGVLGRCVSEQVWSWVLPEISGPVRLPIPFVSAASAVVIDGAVAVPLRLSQGQIWAHVTPETSTLGPVRIDMTVGSPIDTHPAIIAAIKLLVGHWYLNREAVVSGSATSIPLGVDRLLSPLKVSWM